MYYDICSVFNGANQIRSSKRIIDDERNVVAVCNVCYLFDVDEV